MYPRSNQTVEYVETVKIIETRYDAYWPTMKLGFLLRTTSDSERTEFQVCKQSEMFSLLCLRGFMEIDVSKIQKKKKKIVALINLIGTLRKITYFAINM